MNERIINKGNAILVAAYKVVGFALLSVILIGLVSYLAIHGFFVVNDSWVAPTIVSPTDENILGLNTRLAELAAARERLAAERRELKVRLADAERQVAAHTQFQERFAEALQADRTAKARELARLRSLVHEHDLAGEEIASSNRAYSGMSRARAEELKAAQLVTQEGYLTANHQLAQIANSTLSLAERGVDLKTRMAALQREIRALDSARRLAAGEENPGKLALSTTVLLLHRELSESQLALARSTETRDALRDNLVAIDGALATYDALLESIRNSPYMKAIEGNVTVAFVPYENADGAKPGTKLYGCSLAFFWCREVGQVRGVFTGEVSMRHPVRNTQLRGEMVEIQVHDGRWAQKQILHLKRAPLFF